MPDPESTSIVVGIGASAGGVETLQDLFARLSPDAGLTYVVVTHQHPGTTSVLPELLGRCTSLPVVGVTGELDLEPGHVYVSSPGLHLVLEGDRLRALPVPRDAPVGHLPIDYFFGSLARARGPRAIGVLLSGTGSDGTQGLREIKGASGFTLVQDPSTAEYDAMPRSAIAAGVADFVLDVEAMPERLAALRRHAEDAPGEPPERGPLPEAYKTIFALLRSRLGHDFSGYKPSTLLRRVARRISVHQLSDATQYVAYLRRNPNELRALFRDLLIGVTSFFRDPAAFAALAEQGLPTLLEQHDDERPIRVWVPGCSTGEEAYSLAIVLAEAVESAGGHRTIQIFGTDLDPDAIDFARRGRYPASVRGQVGPERLGRFFREREDGYEVAKRIRQMVVFAPHNVISDPPFTRLDLLSCRNLLIYLDATLQRRVIPLFHYALNPGGLLFLGASESIDRFGELFEPVDTKARLFRCRAIGTVPRPLTELRTAGPPPLPPGVGARTASRAASTDLGARLLLRRCVPPSVVFTRDGEVVYIHGRTGLFLEPAEGAARLNVFEMARPGLRLPLASASRAATRERSTKLRARVRTNGDSVEAEVTVQVAGDRGTAPELLIASFVVVEEHDDASPAVHSQAVEDQADTVRAELDQTRATLQGMIEEQETTNEELQSTNEELQSTNEELETSKEEMQSLNEELRAVNVELQAKIDDLSRVNDDLANLLDSNEIATLFLDADLRVMRFNESTRALIRFIDSDVGRPISDIARRVNYDELEADAREVLRTLVFKQRELQCHDGVWYLMRMLPYRTAANVIDGLVITFVNITASKQAEAHAREARGPSYGETHSFPPFKGPNSL